MERRYTCAGTAGHRNPLRHNSLEFIRTPFTIPVNEHNVFTLQGEFGMNLFWELHQNSRIASAGSSAASASSKAGNALSKVQWAEARAEKAMMVCEALWIILREKLDLDEDILEKAVRAVDLQDGKLDGRVRHDVSECPECGKKVGRNRTNCIYCGKPITGNVFG
jgi:hypothetical protein